MVACRPVVNLTAEEKDFFESRLVLRTVEASSFIGEIFQKTLEAPQKPMQFNERIYSAIKSAVVGMLAHTEARLDVMIKRERALADRLEKLEALRNV